MIRIDQIQSIDQGLIIMSIEVAQRLLLSDKSHRLEVIQLLDISLLQIRRRVELILLLVEILIQVAAQEAIEVVVQEAIEVVVQEVIEVAVQEAIEVAVQEVIEVVVQEVVVDPLLHLELSLVADQVQENLHLEVEEVDKIF